MRDFNEGLGLGIDFNLEMGLTFSYNVVDEGRGFGDGDFCAGNGRGAGYGDGSFRNNWGEGTSDYSDYNYSYPYELIQYWKE